jgi:hypothetical protein
MSSYSVYSPLELRPIECARQCLGSYTSAELKASLVISTVFQTRTSNFSHSKVGNVIGVDIFHEFDYQI